MIEERLVEWYSFVPNYGGEESNKMHQGEIIKIF